MSSSQRATRAAPRTESAEEGLAALSASKSVSALAAAAIGETQRRFVQNLSLAARSADPALVHHARVGLRKLRVYVRLFRSRVGRERGERLTRDLRWVFGLLGKLRDVQVFRRDVLPRARASRASLHAFGVRLQRHEEVARVKLQSLAASPRYRSLCGQLAQLEAELQHQDDDKRARRWLAQRLRRMRRRALAEAREVGRDSADLHHLRKRLKKLRYAAELAEALKQKHPKRARKFRARLVALQDALGGLNDLRVARRLLVATRAARPLRRQLLAELTSSQHACAVDLERALSALGEAPAPWD